VGIVLLAANCALRAAICALLLMKALVELLALPFTAMSVFFSRLRDLLDSDTVDTGAIRVPTFYAPPKEDDRSPEAGMTTMIVATLFGGIHCAGWNFSFPSHAELIIWRVSSLIIVIAPYSIVFIVAVGEIGGDGSIAFAFAILLVSVGVVSYVFARLALFVEAFTALRHLPPGAYAVVEWTTLLLHM
jgi:hypothetical protein